VPQSRVERRRATEIKMTDRTEFDRLVKDALGSLYDHAALETHPLTALFPKPPTSRRAARTSFATCC